MFLCKLKSPSLADRAIAIAEHKSKLFVVLMLCAVAVVIIIIIASVVVVVQVIATTIFGGKFNFERDEDNFFISRVEEGNFYERRAGALV